MKRVLVVGHRGMLGSELMKLLGRRGAESPGVEARGVDLPETDITDVASVTDALERHRPDVVVNCAAYTDVDGAESHPDDARRVNAEGPGNLAQAASARGTRIVHLSTDFVFDGLRSVPYVETDEPGPLSVYGRTKLEGELRVARAAPDHLIVRTSWLYGSSGRNFVTTILRLARERDTLTVVDDQRGSPTYTCDLSRAIWELMCTEARGIVHAAGGGACSWYEFAVEILRQASIRTTVRPIPSTELARPARRPANSVLDTTRLRELTGFRFPDWQDSLATFLREIHSKGE